MTHHHITEIDTDMLQHLKIPSNPKRKEASYYSPCLDYPKRSTPSLPIGTVVCHQYEHRSVLSRLASINSLPIEERIKISHNAAGSRIFDELLDSPTILPKVKRQFVMDFIGHYHLLVDDKLGSRVGDRCWAFADTYLKVKSYLLVLSLRKIDICLSRKKLHGHL
jgi:hypothetical protein